MVKVGLLSDTHGWLDPAIVDFFSDCDEIWHAGDVGSPGIIDHLESMATVRAVSGNIDDSRLRLRIPEFQSFTIEGMAVVMIHIGGYPGHYSSRSKGLIRDSRPKLFIAGHSHILKVMRDEENDLLFMNPGAAGNQGFHQVRTALRFTIHNQIPSSLELLEIRR